MEEDKNSKAGKGIKMAFKIAGFVILGIVVAVLFAFLFGMLVVWLWNWLMVDIFSLPEITYWQAVGLVILAKIFFGGLGCHHHNNDEKKKKNKKNDCNNPFSEIKNEIGKEIKKEFAKEFEKEIEKEFKKEENENCTDFGSIFEWDEKKQEFREFWREQGKSAFRDYLNKKYEEDPEED